MAKKGPEGKFDLDGHQGLLIVLSGPSGVGKGTLCTALCKEFDDLHYSISTTTRPPRPTEVNGEDYYFVDRECFLKMERMAQFIEWAEVYGNLYGTPWSQIEYTMKAGRNIILEIDTQGAMQVKEKYPQGIFIFILPPNKKELKERIIGRGTEIEEAIAKRISKLDEELKYIHEYDYAVINDLVYNAIQKLKAIYIAEKCRPSRVLKDWKG